MISQKICNTKSMTLTELVVAVVLIGIVMLGVLTFSLAIRQFQSSADKTVMIKLQAISALTALVKDASSAIGDPKRPGIEIYQNGTTQSICFRHNNPNPLVNKLDSYDDDVWVCYWHGNDMEIFRCDNLANPPPSQSNPFDDFSSDCNNSGEFIVALPRAGGGNGEFFNVIPDGVSIPRNIDRIELFVSAIYDPVRIEHPIENPRYTTSISVNPIGHSK